MPISKYCKVIWITSLGFACGVIASEEGGYKSFNDITAALNPLEVVANHGGIRRSIDLNIQFSLNSADLLPAAQRQIQALGQALNSSKLAHCDIVLLGHTDASGDPEHNATLSHDRALAVKQSLIWDYEVDEVRLVAKGMGQTQLIAKLAPNDAKHRRVEITLADVEACRQNQTPKAIENQVDDEGNVKIKW